MKQNLVALLFGLSLFFLVMAVLYSIILLAPEPEEFLQIFVPLVVFTGFFIFLIGAVLVALSIFKWLSGFKKN